VPDGCKAIIVTDQLLEQFKDWQPLTAPAPYSRIEAKASPADDSLVVEMQTRYAS
jgi:hypothetical protein